MHYGEKRYKHGNGPAASQHQCNADRGHLASVNQGLAADGVIPGETVKGGPWARKNERERRKMTIDWERRKKGAKKGGKKGEH